MSTIATLIIRCSALLMDTGLAIWPAGTLGEAFTQALDQYSAVNPLHVETVVTLPGDGREIALSGVTGLIDVLDVWWPYDTLATAETWPPNRVAGWRLWWDDAQPLLFLEIDAGAQPKTDDEIRIWYTKRHTIEGLDGGSITSIQNDHDSLVVMGAAGHAAMSRTVDLVETAGTDLYQVSILGTWGSRKIREYGQALRRLEKVHARRGRSWGAGWSLDKWDRRDA